MASRSIKHSADISADSATVYQYLTAGEKLQEWFPSRADTEVREGGSYRFTFLGSDGTQDHERTGQFTRLKQDKMVEYDWSFGLGTTTVRFDIQQNGGGSRVLLEHSGFGDGPEWREAFDMHDTGWKMFLENLASVLTGGKDLRKEMHSA